MAPIDTLILSASVLARSAVDAEAGAKALLLRGEDGLAWASATAWVDATASSGTTGRSTPRPASRWRHERRVAHHQGFWVAAFAASAATIWGRGEREVRDEVKAKPLTWPRVSGDRRSPSHMVHVGGCPSTTPDSAGPRSSSRALRRRPLAITAGIGALYGLLLVSTSFYSSAGWARRPGEPSIASFGVFVTSLLHGVWAGTDTSSPLMIGLYLRSAIVVFSLVALRIVAETSRTSPAKEVRGSLLP